MKEQPELKVMEVPVADLVPYANNAKEHSDYQIDTIAKSIDEFGNCDPIAVWHNAQGQMEIVEGHGRLLALQRLGIETAPVITLDHLTDKQRRAYTHIHNQTTLNSGFDFDILTIDMQALDVDWSDFGFGDFSATVGEVFDPSFEDNPTMEKIDGSIVQVSFKSVADCRSCIDQIKAIAERNHGTVSVR